MRHPPRDKLYIKNGMSIWGVDGRGKVDETPPGDEICHKNGISVWEMDGKKVR